MYSKKVLGFFALLAFLLAYSELKAQFYTPHYRPDVEWMEMETEHFRIIYPETAEKSARRSLQILNARYDAIHELVGGELDRLPVIINDYTDHPHGFVSGAPFRVEGGMAPHRDKLFHQRGGGFLEVLMPHELVHAMHFSNTPDHLAGRLFDGISADMAAVFHMTNPTGLVEGIAVYQENSIRPGESGRPNNPFFTNQILANYDSDDQWSLGEMVRFARHTQPRFSRPYIGGYAFTEWLHEEYGEELTKQIIEKGSSYFFLGYGFWLRSVTGKWPRKLSEDYYDYLSRKYDPYLDSIRNEGITRHKFLNKEPEGPYMRSPRYKDEDQLLFYGSFYNERPGLWKYDLRDSSLSRIYTGSLSEGHPYELDSNEQIMASRYFHHPYHENTRELDLFELNPENGETNRLTTGESLNDPQPLEDGSSYFALQTLHNVSQWVRGKGDGVEDTVLSIYPDHIREIDTRPLDEKTAMVASINGGHGLWLVDPDSPSIDKASPDVSFDGEAIYDPTWHPGEEKILFTAALNGILNVYEWDIKEDEVYQVSNALYNAFEPAYHPSGDTIAFVVQKAETREIATLARQDFHGRPVSAEERADDLKAYTQMPRVGEEWEEEVQNISAEPHSEGGGWLIPRAVIPELQFGETFPSQQYGLALRSSNTLKDKTYEFNIAYGEENLWYEGAFEYRGFYPGIDIEGFSRPITVGNWGIRERGGRLSLDMPWLLEQNVHTSRLSFRPNLRVSQWRPIYRDGELIEPGEWRDQYRGGLSVNGILGMQQNIRDVQPNTGLSFGSSVTLGYSEAVQGSPDYGVRGDILGYVSPLSRYNQSLRVGIQGIYSENLILSQSSLLSPGFSTGIDADGVYSLNTYYTIPLTFPDQGWVTLPGELSTVYMALFSNTIGPTPGAISSDMFSDARTAVGADLRARVGIFENLSFAPGLRVSYEIEREEFRLSFLL